jgi:alpha-ribazole phosphatase/probable phosphoglycerate mutase
MTLSLPAPDCRATRLILIRHGEPDESVHGRCYGRLDPALSVRGREQMRQTWLLLGTHRVAAIYSSPSRRAVESANLRIVADPVATVEGRLREIDFGEFEGLTYDEISARYPEEYHQWMTQPAHIAFPGGESFAAMCTRVRAGVDDLRRMHSGQTVMVVSHAGVNRAVVAHALALDPRQIFRLAQDYACVNVIDYIGEEPIVRLMNLTVGPC